MTEHRRFHGKTGKKVTNGRKICYPGHFVLIPISMARLFVHPAIKADEENRRKEDGNIVKGPFLWFCEENCFNDYAAQQKAESGTSIYDSTHDHLPQKFVDDSFEIGCTECKTYALIDNQPDPDGEKRDFEYLAIFLCDHVGRDHVLKVGISEEHALWKNPETANDWKRYE